MRKQTASFHKSIVLVLLVALGVVGCDSGISDPVPDTPTLIFPENGGFDQANFLELQWNASESVLVYDLNVSQTPDFSSLIVDEKDLTGHFYALHDLDIGKTYYWRIRAKNDFGAGEWSREWSFRANEEASIPIAPKLAFPSDNAQQQPTSIFFDWEDIDGATTYHIQVSLESNFIRRSADMESVRTSEQQIRGLIPTYIYFWRVRAKNPLGYSSWSPTWRLVVEDDA